jgi:hypothetical protein
MLTETSTIMTEHEAQKFANEWLEAWKERDVNKIMASLWDDDHVEFHSPLISVSPVIMTGRRKRNIGGIIPHKKTLQTYLEAAFADTNTNTNTDNKEIVNVYCGVDSIAVYYRSINDMSSSLSCDILFLDDHDKKITKVLQNHRAAYVTLQESSVLAQQWVAFWNEGMLEWLHGMMDPHVQLTSPFAAASKSMGQRPSISGVDNVLSYFQGVLERNPRFHLELVDALTGYDSVAILYDPVDGQHRECLVLHLNEHGKVTHLSNHTCRRRNVTNSNNNKRDARRP